MSEVFGESWAVVEGEYKINNFGIFKKGERILNGTISRRDNIKIFSIGKKKYLGSHLVYNSFKNPSLPNAEHIIFLDGDKSNIKFSNLKNLNYDEYRDYMSNLIIFNGKDKENKSGERNIKIIYYANNRPAYHLRMKGYNKVFNTMTEAVRVRDVKNFLMFTRRENIKFNSDNLERFIKPIITLDRNIVIDYENNEAIV